MKEREFFNHMLDKTQKVFYKSSTFVKYGDKNWNFAVCDTPIQKNTGVFFGLNWGGKDIDTQSKYPDANKARNWNFISHSRRYFREFLNAEIEQLNYSNLCFFRSPEAVIIEKDDWSLAIPLFKDYVDYINPPWTLMLGKPNHLWNDHLSNHNTIKIWDSKNNKNVHGYTGLLFGKYPFGAVPHPQANISTKVRKAIWQSVVKENNEFKMSKHSQNEQIR